MMDEAKLLEKLKRIEALYAGATTPGERDAAANARARVQARLEAEQKKFPPKEFTFTLQNPWSRSLFVALARRYNLKPFRYRRQRYTTVVVKADVLFVEKVLWPQFKALDDTLFTYLTEVTNRVIKDAVHADSAEVAVLDEPRALLGS
jgi:tRNA nucleotidyltransferase (CCA-adding enzyme)